MLGGLGDWRIKTSSSRTELWIWTDVSSERNLDTWHGVSWMPSLWFSYYDRAGGMEDTPLGDGVGQLWVRVAREELDAVAGVVHFWTLPERL